MPGGRADLIVGMKGTVASWCLTWSLGMVGLAVAPDKEGDGGRHAEPGAER